MAATVVSVCFVTEVYGLCICLGVGGVCVWGGLCVNVRAFAHVLFLCDVGLYTVQYRSRLCFTDSPGDYRC